MAARTGDAPTRAWALGEWSALVARAPAPSPTDADSKRLLDAVEAQAGVLDRWLRERRAQELERNAAGRELARINGKKADLVPQQAKLKLQQETLRRQQIAAPEAAEQKRLRRQRAEASVRLEDVQAELNKYDGLAGALRERIGAAERAIVAGERHAAEERVRLAERQGQAPGLSAFVDPLMHRLSLACVQFFVSAPPTRRVAFVTEWLAVADALLELLGDMAKGRFRQADVESVAGGRAPFVGEVMWGLLAFGEMERIRRLFDALLPAPFSHQIYAVFRAFVPGLLAHGRTGELREAVSAHRYVQGVRGATAEAIWCWSAGNATGFADALRAVPVYDWRQGHGAGYEGLGLVCTTAAGLARLGASRGWPLPEKALALTAPKELWQPSTT